jgi:hypothetical protein
MDVMGHPGISIIASRPKENSRKQKLVLRITSKSATTRQHTNLLIGGAASFLFYGYCRLPKTLLGFSGCDGHAVLLA